MIVDSSVLIQILFGEPGAEDAVLRLEREPNVLLAAPCLLEAEIVYGTRRGFGTSS